MAPRTKPRLAQPSQVGIVFQHRWQPQSLSAPIAQGKTIPSVDLKALDHSAVSRIHWAAKADPDPLNAVLIYQWFGGLRDLLANPSRSASRVHVTSLQGNQWPAAARSHSQLKFRSTDLDAQIHLAKSLF
jgi:hypothetical protein